MQIGGKPERVELLVNLERYGKGLVEGIKGWTIPNVKLSMWGSEDRFVAVRFDNGISLDILYKSLKFIQKAKENNESPNTK